jgi:hypothetical protein
MFEVRPCEGNRYGSCCHTFEAVRASSAIRPRAEFCPGSCPQKNDVEPALSRVSRKQHLAQLDAET